jgi:Uma2 family endonuclease
VSTAAPRELSPAADPTVYPVKDDVGEDWLQRFISELLRPLIERWLAERGRPMFVGANQYLYWKQFDPHESVSPDVYVLPGAEPYARMGAWLVWKTGLVPTFALEVVSDDVRKDYLRSPPRYDRLGVKELVVFDPDWEESRDRYRFQVFRRPKGHGLIRVEATNADRVRSRVLGCHLRSVGEGPHVRLRVASGPNGDTLFPTDAELARAEQTLREKAQAARERADAASEKAQAEREAREKAEAEIARLKAEIARLAAEGRRPGGASYERASRQRSGVASRP